MLTGVFFRVMWMTSHLVGLKDIFKVFSHWSGLVVVPGHPAGSLFPCTENCHQQTDGM